MHVETSFSTLLETFDVDVYSTFPKSNTVALPYLVYSTSEEQEITLDGTREFLETLFEIDIFTRTRQEVRDLATNMREYLNGYVDKPNNIHLVLFVGGSTINDIWGEKDGQMQENHHMVQVYKVSSYS